VIYEAAKAICRLPGVEANDLSPAITVLQLFLTSPKSSLRFAAIRTLSEVATKHPMSLLKCNDDMEGLVADSNRSIATLAITTLLKTGTEASIDRLMKKISAFMTEIGDEFKIVVVQAVRELCLKYPSKNRVLVGFLSTFLREEGGYDFKKSIVDSILDLIHAIPETKETSLMHLCEFIDDCEFSELIVQVMHVLGRVGPTTSSPSKYIRFVFNRLILENAVVRAAAVTTLGAFAVRLPELRPSILILLKRSLTDDDDEVRDRAATLVRTLESSQDEQALNYLLEEPLPMSFAALDRSLRAYLSHPSAATDARPITLTSLPIVEDAYSQSAAAAKVASTSRAPGSSSGAASKKDSAEPALSSDPASALYKIPEFAHLGRAFRSCPEVALTESEMEYVVSCVKHVFNEHIVLQFSVVNTIDDQRLKDVGVAVEISDEDLYVLENEVRAPVARYGETVYCYVCLARVSDEDDETVPGASVSLSCNLKFHIVQVDPTTGEVEGDEDGYEEEYPLEALDVNTNDFMAKITFPDFRRLWEQTGSEGEVLEKFALQFKKLSEAVAAVVDFLGMQPCDNTGAVTDVSVKNKSHTLHLSGMFLGNVTVLVRAQLQLDDAVGGVVLKIAVRSEKKEISTMVAECIR
jgi:coatomer subunit gamma